VCIVVRREPQCCELARTLKGVVPGLPAVKVPHRATARRYKVGGGEAIEASSMEVDAAILAKPGGAWRTRSRQEQRLSTFFHSPALASCERSELDPSSEVDGPPLHCGNLDLSLLN
jgi:hypothetical protein